MDRNRTATPRQLQIPPLRFGPVGMTKGGRFTLRNSSESVERSGSGYSAATVANRAVPRQNACSLAQGGCHSAWSVVMGSRRIARNAGI
jgi:hypothetical protein